MQFIFRALIWYYGLIFQMGHIGLKPLMMEGIAQLVRAPDCGSGGRGFESHYSPLVGFIILCIIDISHSYQ